jgi:TPR repeat protein
MKIKLLIGLLFVTQLTVSQNFQTIEEVNDACSQLGFMGNEDAEIAVDNILDIIGVFRNFTIQECPDINNAVAKNIETESGHKERYILYDAEFFKRIDDKASNDWAAVSILAHEISHHLNGHALNDKGSNHRFELEADYSSGYYLGRMGATLIEAQSAIQTLRLERATSTHPAKQDRLNAIGKGWSKATGKTNVNSDEDNKKERALELYRKGEKAYQEYKYIDAIDLFEQSVELGNVDAYYYLSNCNYLGFGIELDYKKAYSLAMEGYDKGSIPATYQIGKYLANGYGVIKNKEDAERLFKKNFQVKWFKEQFKKNGIAFHAYTIGYMYHYGFGGVKKDVDEAFLWYQKASSLGDPIAKNNIAIMYQDGISVSQDYVKAKELFLESSEMGLVIAQYSLGNMYYNGLGVEKDYEKAYSWYMKAAEDGFDGAQYMIGNLYWSGRGVEQDYKKSLYWNKKAAEKGNAGSLYNVGIMYSNGFGVEKNDSEALGWFLKAANLGYVNAQSSVGQLYSWGIGVKHDYKKSFLWLQKAANGGSAKAQNSLGWLYIYGQGVEIDYKQAFYWREKSAQQGLDEGQNGLGYHYLNGIGVVRNVDKAIFWYKKAASEGSAIARFNLGFAYTSQENYSEAIKWYLLSAEQGYTPAQYNLGQFYEFGYGVKKSKKTAKKWYKKAADQGHIKAKNKL